MIVVILAAVSAPSLMQISNSAGRKGAVNVLLNAFEQARVAALTSGENTYVGFATELNFDAPSDYLYRAFIIFRDSSVDEKSNGAGNYIVLSKWEFLPKNIYFKEERLTIVGDENGALHTVTIDDSIPGLSSGRAMPVIEFNDFGAVAAPVRASRNDPPISLFISENFYTASNPQGQQTGGYFERISFSRFTGRAQLDITTLN